MTGTVANRNARAEGSGEQSFDRTNRNRQRGRLRAVSWLGTTKPECHPKTQQVEPDGAKGEIQHLSWGELPGESGEEVSRGHSSEESR